MNQRGRSIVALTVVLVILAATPPIRDVFGQQETETTEIPIEFGETMTQSFVDERHFQPTMPDISGYIDANLTDFTPPSTSVYVGEQVVTEITDDFYQVVVLIDYIYVEDDQDGIGMGAGEIFIEGTVNGNYTRYPAVGEEWAIESGGDYEPLVFLLDTKAHRIDLQMEVRDEDTGDDDSLGFFTYTQDTPSNASVELWTDIEDARVRVNVTATNHELTLTAAELLNGHRPFIYVDDETGSTEMPNATLGRVIVGDDDGRNAAVLQYYLYWDSENSPDGGPITFELHKNDFEAVLVYLDLADLTCPYRIVFNDWQYSDITDFPAESMLILEENAIQEDDLSFTTTISEELQPLLGVTTNQTVSKAPISLLEDWEYDTLLNLRTDVRRTSLLGYETFDLNVDTSYHTFDLGPGGEMYGYDYEVQALNDTILKEWYEEIERTFENGTHVWSFFGIDVPIIAPFTHDVMQIFQEPFVISAYSNVVEDAGALTVAQNSGMNFTQSMDLSIGFAFVGNLVVEHPTQVMPGSVGTLIFDLEMDPNDFVVTLGVDYAMNASLVYWFAQSSFSYNTSFTTEINVPLSSIGSILDQLGFGSYEVADVPIIDDYLELSELVIQPAFVGEMVNGVIRLHVWEVIKAAVLYLFPEAQKILDVIDWFLDSIDLTMNPVLQGVVRMDLSVANMPDDVTLNATELEFTGDKKRNYVEMTVDAGAVFDTEDVELDVTNIRYDLDFAINWGLEIAFAGPISAIVDDFTWDIGSFPSLAAEIFSSPDSQFVVDGHQETSGTTTTSSSAESSSSSSETTTATSSTEGDDGNGDGDDTPGLTFFTAVFSVIAIVLLRRNKRFG